MRPYQEISKRMTPPFAYVPLVLGDLVTGSKLRRRHEQCELFGGIVSGFAHFGMPFLASWELDPSCPQFSRIWGQKGDS